MSVNADAELQRMRVDLETAREAAFRELETQRTLTDQMRERIAIQIVAAESTLDEPIAEPIAAKKIRTSAKLAKPRSKEAAASTDDAPSPELVEVPKPSPLTAVVVETQMESDETENPVEPDDPAVEADESSDETEAA